MPGNYQLSVDRLVDEVGAAVELGVRGVHPVRHPGHTRTPTGSSAWDDDGIVQQALRRLRQAFQRRACSSPTSASASTPTTAIAASLTRARRAGSTSTTTRRCRCWPQQCVSHARAGADVVAPSGMMDGMVRRDPPRARRRRASRDVPILSYAAKYASAFYGPFRDAAESPPQFGDRTSYQMDPANGDEALREVALDLDEGADIIMVKPALAYLDIIRRVKDRFGVPVAAYNVSGEFAMVKAAARNGWIDERRVTLEILTSIKRAGADMILTYHARDAAEWHQSSPANEVSPGLRGTNPPVASLTGGWSTHQRSSHHAGRQRSRPVPRRARARQRRHGDRLPGRHKATGQQGRHQAHGLRRSARTTAAVDRFEREVADPQAAQASQHRPLSSAAASYHEDRRSSSWSTSRANRSTASWRAAAGCRGRKSSRSACSSAPPCSTPTSKGIIHRDLKPSNLMILPRRHRQADRLRHRQGHRRDGADRRELAPSARPRTCRRSSAGRAATSTHKIRPVFAGHRCSTSC